MVVSNKMLLLLFVCLFVFSPACVECSCSLSSGPSAVQCQLRTLNSANEDNSSVLIAKATTLSVQCSALYLYESHLRTNHFGYLPQLSSLDLEWCKLGRVPSLAFSGLSGLTRLTLASRNDEWAIVMRVQSDAFTGLQHLKEIHLPNNNIWSLPEGTFCHLNSLQVLNLSSNSLQDFSDLGFSSLRPCDLPLRVLDLSKNGLTVIPQRAFTQVAGVRHIKLNANDLNSLQDFALEGLQDLQTLDLADNELVALPPELFADTPNLQELHLQNNSLSALAPGLFDNLQHLLGLNLSRNDLSQDWIGGKTFSSLIRLVVLDLSHNRIGKIEADVFSALSSLQILNLNHNFIHTVAPNSFVNQRNLHILYLSHNSLENLPPKSVQGLPFLSSLSLDNNKLRSLHKKSLRNCSSLQDLALHNNLLTQVPKAITALTLLRTLDLGDNQISQLSNNSFENLPHLFGLRLAGNGLQTLPVDVFSSVTTLQVLNLAHNNITSLDQKIFNKLKELKVLRLDNNSLQDMNGLLTTQSELKWLNLSSNGLLWFDYAFIPRSVVWLDVHDNQLQQLENYYKLKEGFSLQTLDASENSITELTPLSFPQSLEYINLQKNHISKIEPSTFENKARLKRVDLRFNQIEKMTMSAITISVETTAKSEALFPEFYLASNPLLCDCEMEWLQKINQMSVSSSHYPRLVDVDEIQCRLHNLGMNKDTVRPLMQIRPEEFLCHYQAHCFALCKCCDFFACDCRMQCPQGCSCYHDSTWSANVIQCSRKGHEGVPPLIPMDATSIYLDGNNFTGVLESQAFIGRKKVRELFLNHSQIEAINNQTFNGLTELEVLHLEGNFIRQLEGYEFGNLTSLRELYLHNNKLTHIGSETFSSLHLLELLHLDGNQLTNLPSFQDMPNLKRIYLSGNQWTCNCEFVQNFLSFAKDRVVDMSNVKCFSAKSNDFVQMSSTDNVTCSDALPVTSQDSGVNRLFNLVPILVGVTVFVLVIVFMGIVLFIFRTPIRVWLHSKYGVRVLDPSGQVSKDKFYDAFVSYSLKDDNFVHQVLVPHLEHEDRTYKLCLQHRDLPNNSSISDVFPSFSQLCNKHLMVVSRAFLESEWRQIKYAMQEREAANESEKKRLKPIIILLEELSTLDLAAAPEFNLLMKSCSVVLRWNEPGFWNKLRFYLPDSVLKRCTGRLIRKPDEDTQQCNHEWSYDAVITSNDSSASTRSTIMGGSPRTLSNDNNNQQTVQLVTNPMDTLHHWSNEDWHQDDHTYQTIPQMDNIYHTVDQNSGQAVGCVDVMLPNGRMVPATLVRNQHGKVVPVVQVDTFVTPRIPSPPNMLPGRMTEERQPLHKQQMQQVTFPRTLVYRTHADNNARTNNGHLV